MPRPGLVIEKIFDMNVCAMVKDTIKRKFEFQNGYINFYISRSFVLRSHDPLIKNLTPTV